MSEENEKDPYYTHEEGVRVYHKIYSKKAKAEATKKASEVLCKLVSDLNSVNHPMEEVTILHDLVESHLIIDELITLYGLGRFQTIYNYQRNRK